MAAVLAKRGCTSVNVEFRQEDLEGFRSRKRVSVPWSTGYDMVLIAEQVYAALAPVAEDEELLWGTKVYICVYLRHVTLTVMTGASCRSVPG